MQRLLGSFITLPCHPGVWTEPGTPSSAPVGTGHAAPACGGPRFGQSGAVVLPLGRGCSQPQAHLPLVVLAMDLHEVLLHLHRQVLGREVLHVQEDDKLVPVRSDLKPSTRVGPEGLRLRDGDWLEQPELGGRGSVPGYRNRKNHQGSDRSLRVPGDRGTWDLGASGHSANTQNLRGLLSA